MKIYQMKFSSRPGISSLFVAMGFGLGGAFDCLSLRSWNLVTLILGTGAAGAIGGAFLAYRSEPRRSWMLVATGYGLGFLLGGPISIIAIDESLPFYFFYPMFILGFCTAGATSAALIRPRLISVKNSSISFLVGSAVGGVVIGGLFGSPISKPLVAAIGLLVTLIVGGAVSGASLQFDPAIGEETN